MEGEVSTWLWTTAGCCIQVSRMLSARGTIAEGAWKVKEKGKIFLCKGNNIQIYFFSLKFPVFSQYFSAFSIKKNTKR